MREHDANSVCALNASVLWATTVSRCNKSNNVSVIYLLELLKKPPSRQTSESCSEEEAKSVESVPSFRALVHLLSRLSLNHPNLMEVLSQWILGF